MKNVVCIKLKQLLMFKFGNVKRGGGGLGSPRAIIIGSERVGE